MNEADMCPRPVPPEARRLARAIVRAADRAVTEHADTCPARREAEAPPTIPVRQVSEIVTWMMVQYEATGLWDVEAAGAKFDVPTHVLWRELDRYFKNGYNKRRN